MHIHFAFLTWATATQIALFVKALLGIRNEFKNEPVPEKQKRSFVVSFKVEWQ